MADTAIAITAGSGTNVDTRTEGTNGNHRQVVVLGDPATNAGVAPVDATAGLKVDLGADNDITGTVTANLSATDNAVIDAIELATEATQAALETAGGLVVNLGANNDVTVTGTVTADLGATDNAVLDDIASDTEAIKTSAALLDDVVYAEDTAAQVADKGIGILAVRQDADTSLVGTDNDYANLQVDATGKLKVEVFDGGDSHTVDGTVTANLSATDNAVLDSIDTSTQGILADTAAIQTAVETLDNAISGSEMQVDVVGAIPAGTNVIGKVRLVTALGDEVTDDTDDSIKVTITADDVGIGGGTQYTEDAASAANPVGNMIIGVRDDALSGQTTTDGDNIAARMTDKGELYIKHVDSIPVTDNSGSLTVDGTVTADLGATDNAVLDAIAASTLAIETAVEGTLTVTGGGGGTEYTSDAASPTDPVGATNLVVRDDALSTQETTDGDWTAMRANSRGALWVNHDGNITADLGATDNAVLDAIEADTTTIAGAVSGTEMQVDVLTMPTVTVTATNLDVQSGGADLATTTQAGAIQTAVETIDNAIHVDDAAYTLGTHSGVMMMGFAGTQSVNANDAGAVAMETDGSIHIHDGGNTITVDGTVTANLSGTDNTVLDNIDTSTAGILADTAAIQTAVETIDNAISGSEMQVDVVAALPAGTNAIGKLTPADYDVTSHTAKAVKYYTSTGAATDGIIWSPAAGKRWHVTTLFLNVSAAATVTIEDDLAAGDNAIMKMELAANSGVAIPFGEMYPLTSGEDAADLLITTTAGNVYVTCVGYEI